MTTYTVAQMTVHNPETMREYAKQSSTYVKKHGGRYLARGGEIEWLEQTDCHSRVVIVAWPNKEAAQAFFNDPGYMQVAELRKQASTIETLTIQEGIDYIDEPQLGV